MSTKLPDFSYIGAGRAYMRKVGYAGPRLEVGNCSAIGIAPKETIKKLPDHTTSAGGNRNDVRRTDEVGLSLTMHDLNPTNVARALFGDQTAVAAGALADQELEAGYKGGFVRFPYPEDTSVAPVIKCKNGSTAANRANTTAYALGDYYVPATPNGYFYKVTTAGTSAASPPTFGTVVGGTTVDGTATVTNMGKVTLVANTDYELAPGGFILTTAAPNFTDGQMLRADFTKAASTRIEAMTQAAQEYEFVAVFENEARGGKNVVVEVFRLKLGITGDLPMIGEDFAALVQAGEVLADTTRPAGQSQFFRKDIVS